MRIGVLGASVSSGGTIGGSTIGPGSTLATLPGPCPPGYQIDDTGQICLPVGAIENIGGGVPTSTPPCIPSGSMGPLAVGQTYCPKPLPPGTTASQGFCPPGTDLYQNSVCIPLTSPLWNQVPVPPVAVTLIPGVPDWVLYTVGGLMLFTALRGGM